MLNGDIINLPLPVDFKDLQDELHDLLFEYEELINQIGPAIEQQYISTFGYLEIEAYELEIKEKKLKKKIQLIQKEINHQNKIDLKKINKKLEEIFKKYTEQLKKEKEEFNKNNQTIIIELSDDDTKEIKEKFRKIIKTIHPDINKNISEEEKKLFNQATTAFKHGDLETIRSISAILQNKKENTLDEEYLKERIKNVKKDIKEYKEKFPYNKLEYLEIKEIKEGYIKYLKDLIEKLENNIKKHELMIEELIKN